MKFLSLLALPAVLFSLATALPQPVSLEPRAKPSDADCISAGKYIGWRGSVNRFDPSCTELSRTCWGLANSTSYIWHKTACVAAATCDGPAGLVTLAQCVNPATAALDRMYDLSYNVYANIVGDCAWQEGGCPITQQNYIDWYYGALSSIGTTQWPDVNDVINTYWLPMLEWANTGDTLPYLNFNDWLLYSNVD